MTNIGFAPKHILIADKIKQLILSKHFKVGEKLRPDTQIAHEYGVNKKTVANGMAILVEHGLIARAPGRGTVILRNSELNKQKQSGMVGLIMFSKGHIWQDLSHNITTTLLSRNLYPIFINEDILHPYNKSMIEVFMEKLLNDNIYGMIIDGDEEIPFDFFKRNFKRIKKLVFIDHYQHAKKIDHANYVLVDYEEGGRHLARYFIKKGFRNITFFPNKELSKIGYIGSPQQQIMKGIKEICTDNEINFIDEIPRLLMENGDISKACKMLKKMNCSNIAAGISFDYYAVNTVIPALKSAGIQIPEDISLSGFFNTPWAEEQGLTSLSVKEKSLAQKAVELLLGGKKEKEIAIIPKVVERNSVREC